jgi:hypothetical protein
MKQLGLHFSSWQVGKMSDHWYDKLLKGPVIYEADRYLVRQAELEGGTRLGVFFKGGMCDGEPIFLFVGHFKDLQEIKTRYDA